MAAPPVSGATAALLVCRAGTQVCAIPLEHVLETMRPLPVQPLADLPPFVDGLALIRGSPTPVVDARRLLGASGRLEPCQRYVTLRLGARHAALAVDAVVGVRRVNLGQLGELPPLLRTPGNDLVLALGALDQELLVVLERSRLLPESIWQALGAGAQVH